MAILKFLAIILVYAVVLGFVLGVALAVVRLAIRLLGGIAALPFMVIGGVAGVVFLLADSSIKSVFEKLGSRFRNQRKAENVDDERSGANREEIKAPPPPPHRDPFETLGLAGRVSRKEVKAAYREKMKQYHPDIVAHLAKEFRELAEERTKEINSAYQQALRAAG